jgi:rhodanese-related sulfurtransferase
MAIPSPRRSGAARGTWGATPLSPLELAHRLARRPSPAANASQAKGSPILLIIDLRSRRQFARGHLSGSHRISAGLLLSGEWPPGNLVLVDAGDGQAAQVADALHSAGYSPLIEELSGGFPAWQQAGLPVVSLNAPRIWPWRVGQGGNRGGHGHPSVHGRPCLDPCDGQLAPLWRT